MFLRSIDDLPGVAGVLINQEHDLLVHVRSRLCPGERLSLLRRGNCSGGSRLGNIRTDWPTTQRADVCTASTSASLSASVALRPSSTSTSMAVVAEIALPGRPRWAAYDAATDLSTPTSATPRVVLRIDPDAGRDRQLDRCSGRRATWPLGRRRPPLLRGGWRRARRHRSRQRRSSRPRCRSPAPPTWSGTTRLQRALRRRGRPWQRDGRGHGCSRARRDHHHRTWRSHPRLGSDPHDALRLLSGERRGGALYTQDDGS